MNIMISPLRTLLLVATLLCPLSGLATTVYRTLDEQGVVQFSDSPPTDPTSAEVLEINTTVPPQTEATERRLQAMRETTDRMVADRMARERHRAELRKLSSETQLNRAALAVSPPEQDSYYAPYPVGVYPPLRRHGPGHVHPTPLSGHPAFRPNSSGSSAFSRIRRGYNPQVRDFFNR